jgi:hypothetical protein
MKDEGPIAMMITTLKTTARAMTWLLCLPFAEAR